MSSDTFRCAVANSDPLNVLLLIVTLVYAAALQSVLHIPEMFQGSMVSRQKDYNIDFSSPFLGEWRRHRIKKVRKVA